VDWIITLPTYEEQPNQALSAEQRFRDAFERLKHGVPQVLPKGTRVSQNNVAKEANCDPSALRKSRFPLLVIAIQEWVESNKSDQPSERQNLLKQRQKKRDTRETMADFKKQRDQAIGLLADADLRILELSEKVSDLQARLDEIKPSAKVINVEK
jgi:hypothetical protein